MSRPEKPIDWELVDKLLEAGSIGTEIAAYFSMHPNTFYDRVAEQYKMSFTEYSSLMNQRGEGLLRLAQFEKAIGKTKKGDTQLLTFLGKVRLKQKENETETTDHVQLIQNLDTLMNQIKDYQSNRKIDDNNIMTEQRSA